MLIEPIDRVLLRATVIVVATCTAFSFGWQLSASTPAGSLHGAGTEQPVRSACVLEF